MGTIMGSHADKGCLCSQKMALLLIMLADSRQASCSRINEENQAVPWILRGTRHADNSIRDS